MCHERWSRRMREQAREEGRRIWDLFDRETRDEPPQPLAETEARDDRDPDPVEPSREPFVTGR
jgi:hypothetical protein